MIHPSIHSLIPLIHPPSTMPKKKPSHEQDWSESEWKKGEESSSDEEDDESMAADSMDEKPNDTPTRTRRRTSNNVNYRDDSSINDDSEGEEEDENSDAEVQATASTNTQSVSPGNAAANNQHTRVSPETTTTNNTAVGKCTEKAIYVGDSDDEEEGMASTVNSHDPRETTNANNTAAVATAVSHNNKEKDKAGESRENPIRLDDDSGGEKEEQADAIVRPSSIKPANKPENKQANNTKHPTKQAIVRPSSIKPANNTKRPRPTKQASIASFFINGKDQALRIANGKASRQTDGVGSEGTTGTAVNDESNGPAHTAELPVTGTKKRRHIESKGTFDSATNQSNGLAHTGAEAPVTGTKNHRRFKSKGSTTDNATDENKVAHTADAPVTAKEKRRFKSEGSTTDLGTTDNQGKTKRRRIQVEDDEEEDDSDDDLLIDWSKEEPPMSNEEQRFGESLLEEAQLRVDAAQWKKYMLQPTGNPKAMEIMKPFQAKAFSIVSQFFEYTHGPDNHLQAQLVVRKARRNAGIYTIEYQYATEHRGEKIKAGSSKDLAFRQGKYQKKGHSKHSFKVNFDLDMIDDQTNTALLELYEEAKEALLACEELPSHQKHWFRQMFEKHGNLLGPKVTFVLQSIESAYQAFTPSITESPQEYLVGDLTVEKAWYTDTARDAKRLFDLLPVAIRKAGKKLTIFAISATFCLLISLVSVRICPFLQNSCQRTSFIQDNSFTVRRVHLHLFVFTHG